MDPKQTKAIQGVLTFLKICGLWPNYQHHYILYLVYAVIFQLVFTFCYTMFKCVNFYFLTEVNLITKTLFICLSEVALFAKVINFHFYNKELQLMLVDIQEFKLRNRLEIEVYQKSQLLFKKILRFQLIMAEFAIFFSCVSPVFSSDRVLPYKCIILPN